jgi:hypothetical protein
LVAQAACISIGPIHHNHIENTAITADEGVARRRILKPAE